MLKIKVEKIIEADGRQIPAGSYEQTIIEVDKVELEVLRKVVAAVNNIKQK